MHKKLISSPLSVGPTLWFYTGDTFDHDFNLLLDYAGRFGYQGQKVTILAGITGRLLVTEEGLDLGERSFHQLGISASMNMGRVRPGAHPRFPIDDDLNEVIDFVFGLNLAVDLPSN